jgi:hypothetical protein
MIKNTVQLMNESKTIVQSVTPVDTGNLRDNAIRAYITPTGFRIVMLYTTAFYGAILDTPGPEAPQMHAGWWSTAAHGKVMAYVDASLNNKQNTLHQANTNIAKFKSDDIAKQERFYNSMVADAGRDKFFGGK